MTIPIGIISLMKMIRFNNISRNVLVATVSGERGEGGDACAAGIQHEAGREHPADARGRALPQDSDAQRRGRKLRLSKLMISELLPLEYV